MADSRSDKSLGRELNTAGPTSFLIVGLGEVGQTHIAALDQTPGTEVVAGVDIVELSAEFRGRSLPVYKTVQQAAVYHDPDVVVIATPTSTHAAMCGQAAASFARARILVEKPAADNLTDAQYVLRGIGATRSVDVAYHMSFSPEVTWAVEIAQRDQSQLDIPSAIESWFTDPYSGQIKTAQPRFSDSWIDSGINALSVINRFAEPVERPSLRQIGPDEESTFEARLICQGHVSGQSVRALILTSWHVTDPAKNTRIQYCSGAELVMDHTAVAGYLIRDGAVLGTFSRDRSIPRRTRHYLALYHHWVVESKPLMPSDISLRLHELLLQ
jgi:predicted dehydrogenase